MKNKIPIALIYIRAIFGLLFPVIAYFMAEKGSVLIAILVLLGFLADIFDGIIARILGVSTDALRIIDSAVDRIFWLLVLLSCYMLYPNYILEKIPVLGLVLSIEIIVYLVSYLRFNKIPSPHNLLTKLWGILVAICFVEILLSGQSFSFSVMIIIGIISRIDSLLIYLILKKWDHDIPTFYHAILLRKGGKIKRNKLFNG